MTQPTSSSSPPSPPRPLRVLVVEDSEFDARVMLNELRMGGYDPQYKRVETAGQMRAALAEQTWDVVLADYHLPEFSAPKALEVLHELGLDIPFVVISGGIGDDIAVECMRSGAHDYLMKGNLARLAPAVERELREAKVRAARTAAEQQMRESELRYRLLWETCPDAVLLMDANGYIQFANPAVETVFGYKPVELLGRNVSLLKAPESGEVNPLALVESVRSGRRPSGWMAHQAIGLRKDGRRVLVEITASEMVLQGQRRFVEFIRDITERKRAEEALRAREQEMQVAREIQRLLFPASAPNLEGFDISGASFAADVACGDYYDYLPMPGGRLGLVVADIAGHGVGPALLMAETRAYLRLLTQNREKVDEILTLANSLLVEDVGNERFVTLMLAQLDPQTRTLIYSSAGHPDCYVVDASGTIKTALRRTGPALGIVPSASFRASTSISLAQGDVILLLTDGIQETAAPDESLYESRRAVEFLCQNRTKSASEIVRGLYESVKAFAQGHPLKDDVTALVVKVL